MLGGSEFLVILGVLALIGLFGRKFILKATRDFFGLKKDIEQIKNEAHTK